LFILEINFYYPPITKTVVLPKLAVIGMYQENVRFEVGSGTCEREVLER
jgi:hypothetical protein